MTRQLTGGRQGETQPRAHVQETECISHIQQQTSPLVTRRAGDPRRHFLKRHVGGPQVLSPLPRDVRPRPQRGVTSHCGSGRQQRLETPSAGEGGPGGKGASRAAGGCELCSHGGEQNGGP